MLPNINIFPNLQKQMKQMKQIMKQIDVTDVNLNFAGKLLSLS